MATYHHKIAALLPLPRKAADFIQQIETALWQVLSDEPDVTFPNGVTAEERELLEGTSPMSCEIEWHAGDKWTPAGVWLAGDEGDAMSLAQIAQVAIRHFDPSLLWGFEWSCDCSRPRLDAYGGGAAVVGADRILAFYTSDWLALFSDVTRVR
ncbi:hypothetical protein [Falsiroseomonas sp. HW251]|uniref:hypothetical protein n=1 Tax=Falsiroseomonas sp. HW251 TaxID=3390998 RepID=UPI003D31137F